MKSRIALVSLMPDAGHVLPLLRLAVFFAEQQYEVQGFFPEECARLAAEFGVPMRSFGPVTSLANKGIFRDLSRRSIFYNAFTAYKDIHRNYDYPIALAVAAKIDYIKELIEEYDPALIMADHHLFRILFLNLAGYLNKPLVFHASGGSYRYRDYHDQVNKLITFKINGKRYRFHYDRFLYNYGFTGHLSRFQLLVVNLGEILANKCWKSIENDWKKTEEIFRANIEKAFPAVNTEEIPAITISTGVPFIESEITKNYFVGPSSQLGLNLFPPTRDRRKSEISPQLRQWLEEAGEKPIVYISFGTMVRGNGRFIRKILRGLKELDIYILWAAPSDEIQLIKKLAKLPHLRLEEHVPQPQILALEKVRCFITHAGAGGVQDSLMGGKPMLCIPFMFDQPFNSSVVEMLQAGIKLWKNRVTAKAIRHSVRKLLNDPGYWKAAQELKRELQSKDCGREVVWFLREKKFLIDSEYPGSIHYLHNGSG